MSFFSKNLTLISLIAYNALHLTKGNRMNILNYGAGALGLGIDGCLLKANESVDIVARQETVSALKKHGLIRKGIFGNAAASPDAFSAYTSLNQIPSKTYEIILVSVKSFDSLTAAKDLAAHPSLWNPKTKIVLCQNGCGNAEIFCSLFTKKQIYNARIITGFSRRNPNEVTITVHADDIRIGSLFHSNLKDLKQLCQAITEGGIPCAISPDIGKDLWAKMLYNCALNGLGAILDVPYGVLGEFPSTRELMDGIIDEVFTVMKKAGFKTHWKTAKEYLKIFYTKHLPSTAQHRSSTLQDIEAKKKTEIDALNGAVVKLADQFNAPAPLNRSVYQMVKFIEGKNFKKR